MKALVTGAGGQVGSALVATAAPGWTVLPLTRADLDLTDSNAVRHAIDEHAPDLIFNAAAHTAVDRAESEEAATFAINAKAVSTLAQAAREHGAHLVQISTDFVFDGTASEPYRPGDARNPLSVYSRSKAAGEDAAGPDSTVVRTSWVHAAGHANFVTTMLRLMGERDEVRVVADQTGAPTWATGLAEVTWSLGSRRLSGTWHHSDGGQATWYDFAVAIREEALARGLMDRAACLIPVTTAEYPTAARRPAYSVLDCSATHAALNIAPVPWRANLRHMLAEAA